MDGHAPYRTMTLAVDGERGGYRVDLAIPTGTPPQAGWPALFLLDAGGCFATAVEAVSRMGRRSDATGAAPTAIVGISHSSGHDVARREYDYTSPRQTSDLAPRGGGGASFLAFLGAHVLPLVSGQVAIDSRRRTLFGHSLAGYFALWALGSGSDIFTRYCAVSPSVWWDRDALASSIDRLEDRDRHVVILVGEWEAALPPWQADHPTAEAVRARRRDRDMVGQARDLAGRLATRLDASRVRFAILPEEDHASIVSAAIPRALRLAALP